MLVMSKLDQYLPVKTVSFSSDDQPWFTPELKELDKRRKYEYRKHRRSFHWKTLNSKFKNKVSAIKASYYKKKIEDLREGKPGQWYSLLKQLSSHDQVKSDQPVCEDIRDLPDQQQAELIADRFSSVSNEYSPVDASQIIISVLTMED